MKRLNKWIVGLPMLIVSVGSAADSPPAVPQLTMTEIAFKQAKEYSNPYTEVTARAELTTADGTTRSIPLFWDGGETWKLRFSPNTNGRWTWKTTSNDSGLHGKSGAFEAIASRSDRQETFVQVWGGVGDGRKPAPSACSEQITLRPTKPCKLPNRSAKSLR